MRVGESEIYAGREIVKKSDWLVIGLVLLVSLMLWGRASAAGPSNGGPNRDNGDTDPARRVALVSTEAKCLAVQGGIPHRVSAVVRLQWEGQVEWAFLVLSVRGSQGGHSVYVNGHRVGAVRAQPDGPPCQPGCPVDLIGPFDMIPIPVEVVEKGENVVTLTNDANIHDGWTAASLHIEIHGILGGPPVAALEATSLVLPAITATAAGPISGTFLLTSTYELAQGWVISQAVSYQIPMGYDGSISVPLLIGIHGMGGSGQSTRDFLATEADRRGWLLAVPEMHGNYYVNTGSYALAWPGAQHDVMDTIEYILSRYEVDLSRIYVTGGSMGGQTTAMMAAKYPDVFAAAVPWKPLTDLTDWYYDLGALGDPYNTLPRIRYETGGTPVTRAFEYQRRSPILMPQNSLLVPIRMWHDVDDRLVPIYHSRDLRTAINSWAPVLPVTLIEIAADENECPTDPYDHCYNPSLAEVFDFLESFTLSSRPPLSLAIRTDESKPYYWLRFAQTGGDHWSHVWASYDLTRTTVAAVVTDTHPLTLAFNLGSTPIMGRVSAYPGMGLPATTYLVNGGGNHKLEDYSSGYLTAALSATDQFTLTISALEASLSANPPMVSVLGWQTATSTISAVFRDHLSNPVPDGTTVQFSASEGAFPNASSTYTATVMAGAQGQVTATLILTPLADLAHIIARVESVTASTSADVVHPAIDIRVMTDQTPTLGGQLVTSTYGITNTGDITLTSLMVVDDRGTPGDNSDDLVVCEYAVLSAGAARSCSSNAVLTRTMTTTATVTGRDPLGQYVSKSDSTTTIVVKVYLPIVARTGTTGKPFFP